MAIDYKEQIDYKAHQATRTFSDYTKREKIVAVICIIITVLLFSALGIQLLMAEKTEDTAALREDITVSESEAEVLFEESSSGQ